MFKYFLQVALKSPVRYIPFFIKNRKLLFTESLLVDIIVEWYKLQNRYYSGVAFDAIKVEQLDFSKRSYCLRFTFPTLLDSKGNHIHLIVDYYNHCNADVHFKIKLNYLADNYTIENMYYLDDCYDLTNEFNNTQFTKMQADIITYYLSGIKV